MHHMRIYKLAVTRLLVLIGLLSVVALIIIPASDARELQQIDINTESLPANYALVGTGGAYSAYSVGIEAYDGKVNVTRSLLLYKPASDKTRSLVR